MLLFQVVLLFGYLYAHWVHRWVTPRRQAVFHTLVLAVSLLILPIAPQASWKPAPGDNPSLRILGLLSFTVGLPYFALSTTSSLLPVMVRAHASPRRPLPSVCAVKRRLAAGSGDLSAGRSRPGPPDCKPTPGQWPMPALSCCAPVRRGWGRLSVRPRA